MKHHVVSALSALAVATIGLSAPARAEPTEIAVRVVSKDAKFVGTSMGGVRIILRDAQTGEVLATGVTSGGTGNTKLLMHKDGGRRAVMSDDSAAKYVATLDIDEPVFVEAEAYGPLAQAQAAHRVTATQWVVPGKDISGGDGWVLVLPGFVVDVLAPPTHIKLAADTKSVELKANVTMMCGCPIEPDGIWDANGYEVSALIKRNGEQIGEVPLSYAGATSQFAGTYIVEQPGTYEAIVYAYDPANGNTGLDHVTFIVSE